MRAFFTVAILVSVLKGYGQIDPVEIIKKSYNAHGGVHATDSLKVAFKFASRTRINEGQSFVTKAPFETYLTDDEYWIDRPSGTSVFKTIGTLAGGFVDWHVFSLSHGKGYDLNVTNKFYREITSLPNPRQLTQNFLLKSALANNSRITLVDHDQSSYHLKIDTVDVFINKNNLLVERIERNLYESHSGKGRLSITLQKYRQVGNVMIPQKYITQKTNMVYGTITNAYDISDIRTEFEIPADLLTVPNGFVMRTPGTRDCEVTKLAEGLHLIESIEGKGGLYQILVAEFSDYLLLTEAPLDVATSRRVIQKVKELFPSKPIRYMVQSHSHYDHMGGVLGYTEEGATVVASKDAAGVINKMWKAFEESTGRPWKAPIIETVKKEWAVSDETNSCIVFNIGPNPHSREMLVAWFPKQRVLYQADVFEPSLRHLPSNVEFIKKIKTLNLNIETLVPVHGNIARGEEITELVRQ